MPRSIVAVALCLGACAHDGGGGWFEQESASERDAQRTTLQALAGLGSMLAVSGTAAGLMALLERDDCLEAECVGPFVITAGLVVVSQWALGALMWAVGESQAGTGKLGPTLLGSITGGVVTAAGMIALIAADDDLVEDLWAGTLLITAPVAGGSTIGGLIGYHASE